MLLIMGSLGSCPPCKGMEREVNSVPGLKIGSGAKPGPNDDMKYVNPVPALGSDTKGREPKALAMENEVNSVKGKNGGSAKSVGGWNSRRNGKKK